MEHMNRAMGVGLTGIAVLALVASPSASAEQTPPAYVAVIDAGSSGTRLTLYADDPDSLVPIAMTVANTRTKGLSAFAVAPDQAGPAAISPILGELQAYLSNNNISPTAVPVALLATAGLRNVRNADPAAAQAILSSTASAIRAAGHPIAANRILPGVQEATLAWLDTNALADTLDGNRRTLGIVEIGGASAQVAFESSDIEGRSVHVVTVDGSSIPVVATSYLGLGANDARDFMQAENDAGSFCFPNNAAGIDPLIYMSDSSRPVESGTARYSWDRCAHAYLSVITQVGRQRTSTARTAPWQLRDVPTFATTKFIGLGGIPFNYSDLMIPPSANPRAALKGSTQRTCAGPNAWQRVNTLFVGRSNSIAETICSSSTYQYQFLFGDRGIELAPNQLIVSTANLPRAPAWTSGYAITVLDP